jgi:hypothetical protein
VSDIEDVAGNPPPADGDLTVEEDPGIDLNGYILTVVKIAGEALLARRR